MYLDSLESSGVIVGKLLEDMSCGEAKWAQAMQDGSLETWAESNFKHTLDQMTSFGLQDTTMKPH